MSRFSTAVLMLVFCICVLAFVQAAFAQDQGSSTADGVESPDMGVTVSARQYVTRVFEQDGKLIEEITVQGLPPRDYRMPVASVPASNPVMGINVLGEVPAFDWSYGCSATSAAMLMGYYDRHGYPNMYAGPTNGGVCPLNNSVWGHASYPGVVCGECPLSATKQGVDGRATRGHVNDYWIQPNNVGPDPYITYGWTQHTWDCTADFMGTNQSSYGNFDGATTFYYWPDGSPMCNYDASSSGKIDGCYGMARFAESRGYTVVNNCTQCIYGYNGNTQGFTFAQYCAEIDAGRPVLIQLLGHTMLGYGYNTSGNVIYLHDTWDYYEHTMTWGGSYSGMQHYAVTTFQLTQATPAIVTDVNSLSVPEGGTSTFQVKLSNAPAGDVTVLVSRVSGDSDITVQSGSSLAFNTTNWNTYQTVTLAAAQDTDTIDGTAAIRCSGSGVTSKDVTATEADDDRVILADRSSLGIAEGAQGTFYVKLKGQPSGTVVVSVSRASGDADIYVQSGSSLTFTTGNWNTYQPVTIAAAQDSDTIDDSALIRSSLVNWISADVNVTATDDDSMGISQMKRLGNGASVGCGAAVVTAAFGESFYIEDDDRSSGIRVHRAGHNLAPPMRAGVTGTIQTGPDGERFIEATYAAQTGSGTIKPLGLVNRAVGGGDWFYNGSTGAGQRCVLDGTGLNNIGLLVRTSGKVIGRQSANGSSISFWNFDTNPGWTFEGQWAWGAPTGSGNYYYGYDPTSGFTGSNVVGYNLSGFYPDNMASTLYARTPAINCQGYRSVKLRFYRWLGIEDSIYDRANIQVSKDGVNWTNVWTHSGYGFSESSWSLQEYDISLTADNQPTVYIRWGMGPTDYSYTYPGWNIDDVEIIGTGDSYCTIDDGSGVNLKVLIPSSMTVPAIDAQIRVTGISSCENDGTNLHPVLKVRGVGDID